MKKYIVLLILLPLFYACNKQKDDDGYYYNRIETDFELMTGVFLKKQYSATYNDTVYEIWKFTNPITVEGYGKILDFTRYTIIPADTGWVEITGKLTPLETAKKNFTIVLGSLWYSSIDSSSMQTSVKIQDDVNLYLGGQYNFYFDGHKRSVQLKNVYLGNPSLSSIPLAVNGGMFLKINAQQEDVIKEHAKQGTAQNYMQKQPVWKY